MPAGLRWKYQETKTRYNVRWAMRHLKIDYSRDLYRFGLPIIGNRSDRHRCVVPVSSFLAWIGSTSAAMSLSRPTVYRQVQGRLPGLRDSKGTR